MKKNLFKLLALVVIGLSTSMFMSCNNDNNDDDDTPEIKYFDPKDVLLEVTSPYGVMETVDTIMNRVVNTTNWTLVGAGGVSGNETQPTHLSNLINNKPPWQAAPNYELLEDLYVIEICNPAYAGGILQDDAARYASVMMPCVITVYSKKSDDVTYVSYVNAKMVGKIFGGSIEAIMSNSVAADQQQILGFCEGLKPLDYDWGNIPSGLVPTSMIKEVQAPAGWTLDQTVDTIRARTNGSDAVVSGWGFFRERETTHLDESIENKPAWTGGDLLPVRLIEICNPVHAGTILVDDASRYASVMMPCCITVYEKAGGEVWVGYMNASNMGQIMGGTVQDVIGGSVADEQAAILGFLDI